MEDEIALRAWRAKDKGRAKGGGREEKKGGRAGKMGRKRGEREGGECVQGVKGKG